MPDVTPDRKPSSVAVTEEVTAFELASVANALEAVQPVSRKSPPTTRFPVTLPAAIVAVPEMFGDAKTAEATAE
jgi:hypothetical protein